MIRNFFIFSFLYCGALGAQDRPPWMGEELKISPYAKYTFQSFQEIESSCRDQPYSERAHFLNLGLGSSVFQWSANLELVGAKTRHQDCNIDQLNLIITKHIFNDILGDPFALSMGAKIIQAFKNSLYDVSSFHHGQFEVECYVSMGKECAKSFYWLNRYWILGAIGQADRGYPWLRGNFILEKQWWPRHRLTLLGELLLGTGNKTINLCEFKGYGPIAHRSIDLGIQYHYLVDSDVEFTMGYEYRVYAQNFPKHAQFFSIKLQNYISPFDFLPARWLISNFGKK